MKKKTTEMEKIDWSELLGLETEDAQTKALFNFLVGGFQEPKPNTKVSNWDK